MAAINQSDETKSSHHSLTNAQPKRRGTLQGQTWKDFLRKTDPARPSSTTSVEDSDKIQKQPERWSLGVLNDEETDEVPGTILLMSGPSKRNEPLGLRIAPARTSASSLPSPYPPGFARARPNSPHSREAMKKTANGKIILEPQPDDSLNDPLNWPEWRRDIALLSLGFYCMVGGGMTPILAAGFTNVAATYHVSIPKVALTTGFYMMGLGLGSVVASPTAILFGKRPVYLVGSILLLISSVWCALSPNYSSLVIARIFMGLAVSPVECLPSATIAEIFFLHERAYRLGIYTLLLLGGKNLVPLVSAAIIQSLDWRWVFWIVAMVAGFCFALLFLFVPETFWDRTPRPKDKSRKGTLASWSIMFHGQTRRSGRSSDAPGGVDGPADMRKLAIEQSATAAGNRPATIAERRQKKNRPLVGFTDGGKPERASPTQELPTHSFHATQMPTAAPVDALGNPPSGHISTTTIGERIAGTGSSAAPPNHAYSPALHSESWRVQPTGQAPQTPGLHSFNSPYYLGAEKPDTDYLKNEHVDPACLVNTPGSGPTPAPATAIPGTATNPSEKSPPLPADSHRYTAHLRTQPPKTFYQTLKPWNGRLRRDRWLKVAFRPFVLFAYPAILWSTLVYSLSIGWLIVLSESMSTIYRSKSTYNFNALGTGLVYISPFIGGILGTAVAGRVSDIVVRFMSRRNSGIYEPEFRLVMALPIAITTTIGLMGFGWSVAERDKWIVPTVFFGIISFGCSLGSTTAITFAVDSYRQYAGEALVTLNFSKNIFHGLVFSLFFNRWLDADGSKNVFVAIGGIQLACLLTTVPMYIYGKRCRMWTVRKNLMEKF